MSQPGRSRGGPRGGRFAPVPRTEPGVARGPLEDGRIEWPALEWEGQRWDAPATGLTRRERTGRGARYFSAVPATISDRSLAIQGPLLADLDEATARLSQFDAESRSLPAPLVGVLLRSESASSSQIEQITASARAIAEAEITGQGSGNAAVIAANVHAMTDALGATGPITADAIEGVQRSLMRHTPQLAGWRTGPVWVGGAGSDPMTADFVPPGHDRIPRAIDDLVSFAARDDLPVVAQAAIAHAQFETIHPFSDGNGRTGRALVHLLLQSKGLTTSATVPVSGGLLVNKRGYFEALNDYRAGDAGPIVAVFARASLHAVDAGRRLATRVADVQDRWRRQITARSDSAIWRVIDALPAHPVTDAEGIAAAVGGDSRNIHRQLRALVDAGILVGGQHYKSRRYLFRAPELLQVLDEYAQDFGHRSR